MKLVLLRHAQTTAPDGHCYGRSDVSVQPEVTRALAERLAPALPRAALMRCSPLSRCAELARAIALLRPDLRVVADPRIAEMDFGRWEGRPWASIPRAEMDAWMGNFADARAGIDGESTRLFMQRVGLAFDDWRDGVDDRRQDTVWVTHAGVIRAVSLLHAGRRSVEEAGQWPSRPIEFGASLSFEA